MQTLNDIGDVAKCVGSVAELLGNYDADDDVNESDEGLNSIFDFGSEDPPV